MHKEFRKGSPEHFLFEISQAVAASRYMGMGHLKLHGATSAGSLVWLELHGVTWELSWAVDESAWMWPLYHGGLKGV